MIGRTLALRWGTAVVSASLLGLLACLAAALALSATPAFAVEACPNEELRQESNTNPVTGQPYSTGLRDCRAYEMVSPLYKQAHEARPTVEGLPVAPDGEAAGFASEGDFSDPENFRVNIHPVNVYMSQRGLSGWFTSSTFAPRNLVDEPFLLGLEGDSSLDLRSARVSCGLAPGGSRGEQEGENVVCAMREPDGSWVATPTYTNIEGSTQFANPEGYIGGSSDLSRVVIQVVSPLLKNDIVGSAGSGSGLYEIAGVGTASPELRLVNVDNSGSVLLNQEGEAPLLGNRRVRDEVGGSSYHAISESGDTVFFTASPVGSEIQTIYARIHCVAGSSPSCKEDGNNEWLETVPVSSPSHSECTACSMTAPPRAATFVGASADGSKVFFMTKQRLLSQEEEGEEGTTRNLYEYDFANEEGKKLVLLSPDEEGAAVAGVVRTSSDGSHVYFVATGVLTTVKNANGEVAHAGRLNLYGYGCETVAGEPKCEIKLVSATGADDEVEEGLRPHFAQTTPDGRYLVFSIAAQLAGDTNSTTARAVYRYDFQTGELTWVSHAAAGFTTRDEGENAFVEPLPSSHIGAYASIDDWNRAISENGEYIMFATPEKLQNGDENKAPDVYEWHNGTVGMISDGHAPHGVGSEIQPVAAMSASGSDIFFATPTPLVAQDTDVLGDVYDARTGGGFPKPASETSCPSESQGGCQGKESAPPSFGSAASSSFIAGGNLTPPAISVAPSMESRPRPATRAQKLAKALKACRGKPRKKRASCEAQARRKYGGKAKAKRKAKAGKGDRRTR